MLNFKARKMKNNFKFLIIGAAMAVGFSACKKDKPLPDVNEEELITTVRLKFTNTANSADVRIFTARDLDGDGGQAPVVDQINLTSNATYNFEISEILNETEDPVEDIKAEVAEENDEHLIVYNANPSGLLAITVTDKDANNLAVGLQGTASTATIGSGTLNVKLKHQPDGTKNGTEAPGSTDFDFTFPVSITVL